MACVALATALPVLAQEDPYVKALQDAAKAQAGGAAPARPADTPSQGWNAGNQEMGGALPPQLTRPQFEDALQKSFFGTYMFYSKLGEADKESVYKEYQGNNQISRIRDKTMQLLKK